MSQELFIKSDVQAKLLEPRETWRIMKNVVVISLAFMFQFTAYNVSRYLPISNLVVL